MTDASETGASGTSAPGTDTSETSTSEASTPGADAPGTTEPGTTEPGTDAPGATEPERPEPPMTGDERVQLTGFLDFLRASVVWKCSGLTDEQARRSLVPSELTTVAGLLGHLTLVEAWWFRSVLDGQPDEWEERLKIDRDAEFRAAMETPMDQLIADYQAEIERCRAVVAARGFDDTVTLPKGKEVSVRWVVVHMIEETARHLGHLDLLREMTDGRTGE